MPAPTVDYVFGEVRIGHNEGCLQAIVTSDGGQPITERGIVYSLSSVNTTPAIGGTGVTKVVASGTGLGFYRNLISGLTPNGANYTFRYYAINAAGTGYHGSYSSFVTAASPGSVPQLFDNQSTAQTSTTATLEMLLGLEGAGPITSIGFVYSETSTNPSPAIGGSGVTQVSTTGGRGALSMVITGLTPNTTYSFAAFAIGSATAYSAVGTFNTGKLVAYHQAKVISRNPGPWSNPRCVQVLARPSVDTDSSGWDVMRETLLVPYTPYFQAGQRRDHMLDLSAQPFAHMVVQFERTIGNFGGFPIVELTSLGLAREKPWKCVTTGDTQGTVGGSGVTRNLPTVTCYWFSTTLEGTKLIVPWPAAPPETFGFAALSGNSAGGQGWYIIKRDVDPLPVITGTFPPVELAATIAGNTTRTSANLHPRPALCAVVDYYVYDPLNIVPPND